MKRNIMRSFAITTFLVLQLTACGGGSDEGAVTPPVIPPVNPPPPVTTAVTGVFIDSAVSGLAYTTDSKSGFTDDEGSFEYIAGDNITFSIGDVVLGSAAAGPLITPLSLFNTEDYTDVRVINMARLLQTLDQDSQPENGITLSDDVVAVVNAVAAAGFDFSDPEFAQNNVVTSVLATLGIENLISTEDALQHLISSLAENYQEHNKALPIKAFNALAGSNNLYTNVFTPESNTASELWVDVLDDGFQSPRYDKPFAYPAFYDYSGKHAATGANLGQVYIWVDDALSTKPVVKIRLFDLDIARLTSAGLGIGYQIKAVNPQSQSVVYDYTVVIDPATWFGTIFDGETLLWDEVNALGAYDEGAGKVNLWLPLESINRQYADFAILPQMTIQFFYFKLNNLEVVDSYPAIESAFEQITAITSDTLSLDFTATTRRTDFPYGENNSACRYTTEISYTGAISLSADGNGGFSHWESVSPKFFGSNSRKEKPDNIDHNGLTHPCSDSNFPYDTSSNGFRKHYASNGLTANDLFRLFTPVYNQWWYSNSSFFVPEEVRQNPQSFVQDYAYNPFTKTVTISGTASCGGIINCYSADMDDIFDWKLTIAVPQ